MGNSASKLDPPSDPNITPRYKSCCDYPECTTKPLYNNQFCTQHAGKGLSSSWYSPPETEPLLTLLKPETDEFAKVTKQFQSKWDEKKGDKPTVISIIDIVMSRKFIEQFQLYQQEVIKKRPKYKFQGYNNWDGPGNLARRFHSSAHLKCTLGLNDNNKLCAIEGCSVCSILRTGFLLSKCKSAVEFSRFGNGMYLTSWSSKSNDYNTVNEAVYGGKIRGTFLVHTILGEPYRTKKNEKSLTEPPKNYDSVVGVIGKALNYDECVIYRENAVLPAYWIVYGWE